MLQFYKHSTMYLLKRKYLFPLIWLGLIVYASLTPSNNFPHFNVFPHFDKFVHFCIYLGLSFLLVPALVRNKKYLQSYFISFLLSMSVGIIFELLQTYFSTTRSGSMFDELANVAGALVGVIIYQLMFRNRKIEQVIFRIE